MQAADIDRLTDEGQKTFFRAGGCSFLQAKEKIMLHLWPWIWYNPKNEGMNAVKQEIISEVLEVSGTSGFLPPQGVWASAKKRVGGGKIRHAGIGGGAAGMIACIMATDRGVSVDVYERNDKLGKRL